MYLSSVSVNGVAVCRTISLERMVLRRRRAVESDVREESTTYSEAGDVGLESEFADIELESQSDHAASIPGPSRTQNEELGDTNEAEHDNEADLSQLGISSESDSEF